MQAVTGAAAAAWGGELAEDAMAPYLLGGPGPQIPENKGYTPEMLAALRARGERRVYRGEHTFAIGMPVGGLCAGQVYILGDGTLGGWHIDGRLNATGYGSESYRTKKPPRELKQGFEVAVASSRVAPLELAAFRDIEFVGEYPVAEVRYGDPPVGSDDPAAGLRVTLRAYSPFCPLNARASATPGTVLRIMIRNAGPGPIRGTLRGFLENGVERGDEGDVPVLRRNRVVKERGLTAVVMDALPAEARADPRPPRVLADFEEEAYRGWTAEGQAFTPGPVRGTQPHQNTVTGYAGQRLVNSFVAAEDTAAGDRATGRLTSDPFTIDRDYLCFLIGGGGHAGRTCMNLLVDGRVVRTAAGRTSEKLEPRAWDVREFAGREARLQIVDAHPGGWGHVSVDQVELRDTIPEAARRPRPDSLSNGTMCLAHLGDGKAATDLSADGDVPERRSDGAAPVARVDAPFSLGPGETVEQVFVISWHFPNLHTGQGQMYANWFEDALAVARHLRDNDRRLHDQTELFRRTYYEDATLPWWLALRLMMPTANLASGTAQWWKNGRFWGWEGVGCCHGTCTHVWNYSHAEARLFPELARSTRIMQDLGSALDGATGRVAFRGEVGGGFAYAADGQAGTILKCYREHLCSPDRSFLDAHWPRIRKALDFLVMKDSEHGAEAGDPDGVITGSQHNTFDIDFVGPNTFVGSLYLAALEAGARMSDLSGEPAAAERYRAIARRGREWTERNLFNGRWFVQKLEPGQDTRWQYGDGCLADQLFGQTWAGLLDLPDVYDREMMLAALRSVYRHNFVPPGGALGVYNTMWPAEREFAAPREGGVLTCTWPQGGRPAEPVRYRDEVWTGIEYQVATGMLLLGLVDEALTIIRAIDDRYDGALHNPWNEVECGDHYARAMASWGAYQALCGFVYDGPAGEIGFDPRLTPEQFSAFFTGAEGWGLIRQERLEREQVNAVEVRSGRLRVGRLRIRLPANTAPVNVSASIEDGARPRRLASPFISATDGRYAATLPTPVILEPGQRFVVRWGW